MNKVLKTTILFTALLLPVCIFVFLKFFGSNQFDIPVYYSSSDEIADVPCERVIVPYIFDISKLKDFKNVSENTIISNKITVIANLSKNSRDISYYFARLTERLGDDYQLIVFDDTLDNRLAENRGIVHLKVNENFESFWKCGLLNIDLYQWVLLDDEYRIRGYYEISEKEIDRLIVEVKILQENSKK